MLTLLTNIVIPPVALLAWVKIKACYVIPSYQTSVFVYVGLMHNIIIYTTKFVPFCSLNLRHTVVEEKAGQGDEGQQKPQGESISG